MIKTIDIKNITHEMWALRNKSDDIMWHGAISEVIALIEGAK